MKKTAYYYLSLAAIVAGGLVSCQDDDRGFTTEEVKASVYEKEFIKAFGQPAVGHQWGFDAQPFFVMEQSFAPTRSYHAGTRGTALDFSSAGLGTFQTKPMSPPYYDNKAISAFFDVPDMISETEHEEVYYWFSHHKVNWTNEQPTNCLDPHSRDCDGTAYEFLPDGETELDYGSLSAYAGNASIGTEFSVNWAWLQNIASDEEHDEHHWNREDKVEEELINADGGNMSELCFRLSDDAIYYTEDWSHGWPPAKIPHTEDAGKYQHMQSFNGGGGPGYGSATQIMSDANALFILQSNFNDCIYQCTAGGFGSYHNKYYIVYLEGVDKVTGKPYSGYYLGMDYEADGTNPANRNESVKANGVCNDWIVKLTVPEAKIVQGQPQRIMCEDLGGVYDYDFNDIVIDVTPSTSKHNNGNNDKGDVPYLEVKLQALGGTLPIYVTYDDHALWGAAEQDLHLLFNKGAGYPVNVTNNSDNGAYDASPLVANVVKTSDKRTNYNGYSVDLTGAIETNSDFDYKKIHIYVKREAEWIQLANFAGEAPLKICVPQTVGWAIECAGMPGTSISPKSESDYWDLSSGRSIGCAYPSFMGWVNDPTQYFWEKSVVNTYIY